MLRNLNLKRIILKIGIERLISSVINLADLTIYSVKDKL